MEPSLSLPLTEENVNPRVWVDEKSVGWAQNTIPVVVKLKDSHLFPHKKQYPLKPEVKEGLKPITENLKEQGLLIPCNSPFYTPILGINMSNNKWRLVQDWQIINEAVVPLYPVEPNPYTLLSSMKSCCWAMKDTSILGLQRRGIQSGATDEAWSLRAFV